jgi:hypothetical protein
MPMIQSTGLVHKMVAKAGAGGSVCAYVGPSADDVEPFSVYFSSDQSANEAANGCVATLASAMSARLGVTVSHESTSGEIKLVAVHI